MNQGQRTAVADSTADAGDAGPAMEAGKAPGLRKVVAVILLLTAGVAAMLVAFGLPAVNSGPHHVPIAVSGPAGETETLETALERAHPDGFEVTRVADESALREAIERREVYGGIVVGQGETQILTASAGSLIVAQTLNGFANVLGGQSGTRVTVDDVVPLPKDDPRGAGLSAAVLPMVFAGMIPAMIFTQVLKGKRRVMQRVIAVSAAAVVGGFAVTAILQFWFGSLAGNYVLTAAGFALGTASMSLLYVGLEAVIGGAGLGIGVAIVMLLGNPLSGLASAPEWLPAGWGTFGQLLPPGASGTLLRSLGFFDGNGAQSAVLVLLGWVGLGLGLSVLSQFIPAKATARTSTAGGE